MCGIAGIFALTGGAKKYEQHLDNALAALSKRGPDNRGKFFQNRVGMGHTRLSIIDVSEAGNQPMFDASGRFAVVYNGEIYNFKDLRRQIEQKGIPLKSHTDTEVLVNLYALYKEKCLEFLNGFFAFAIFDTFEQTLFLARDRMGIKPLLFYQDNEKIIFASEMKAILAFPINKALDFTSLYLYLQLNYIPAPSSIFKHVKKIEPGHYMTISPDGFIGIKQYFHISYDPLSRNGKTRNYQEAKETLKSLLGESVKKRLVADVPLGAFLSGGIDSSVIVSLASRFTDKLSTFSIGFKDEPFFDETRYADLVAKKFNTEHTVFSLTTKDLYDCLFEVLDYTDEPFADSSAIAVYILSKHTRAKVKVALSGDGADELFGGYNKHLAEFRMKHSGLFNFLVKLNRPLFALLPQSRNGRLGNFVRQINRYAEGMGLKAEDRYWRWCSFASEQEAANILSASDEPVENTEYHSRKSALLTYHKKEGTINDILYTDMHLVLPNDMLTKVDMMSMANSLEVRVPFLDHHLVNYVFSLPADYKIHNGFRKRILKDAFRDELPPELYKRNKQGFEVPLLKWFRSELRDMIEKELLASERIRSQGIFSPAYVQALKRKLFSSSPGEAAAQIWGLLVFQYWHRKYLE